MTNRMKVGLIVVVIALLSVLAFGVAGAQGWNDIWADLRLHNKLWVNSTSEFDGAVVMDSTLAVTGVATFTGAPVFSGGVAAVDSAAGVELTTFFDVDAATSITVTNGAAFTPTGTYQPITAAGEVTPTITANTDAGTFLVLVNTSAQTINIADTTRSAGALALAQYDSMTFISDGTGWVELSRSNN